MGRPYGRPRRAGTGSWQAGRVPARLRPADPSQVAEASDRLRTAEATPADLRLLVKHYLALLQQRAPGGAVEVRVPPYSAVQVIGGTTHKRGTPPAVVEMSAETWLGLATGELTWPEAERDGLLLASGERSDLTPHLPLVPGGATGSTSGS
ncbi:hypothetical protein G7072_19115 [Nocardioides sp. HDW12B]|nr:hypothetical protein G7072_19115 [Nocardioides sp. HDW12B]